MAEIKDILAGAVQCRASDILLVPQQTPVVRVDGSLAALPNLPAADAAECHRWIYSLMDARLRQEFERDREIDFAYAVPGIGRFRVNVFYQGQGVAAALRCVPSE